MKALRCLALFFLSTPLFAATLRVNNTPGTAPDHATIQAAIDAAIDGDTILIEGSTTPYDGFNVVNKRLSLIGPGYRLSSNAGTPANKLGAVIQHGSAYILQPSSSGSATGTLVMGLEFKTYLNLDFCSGVTVARCFFDGSSSNGRLVVNGPSNVVLQNFFSGSGNLQLRSNAHGSKIENNILFGDLSISGDSFNPPVLTFRHNLFANSTSFSLPDVNATFENNIFNTPPPYGPSGLYFRNNIFTSSLPPDFNGSGNLASVNLSTVMPAYQNSGASFDGRYLLALSPPPGGPTNPALNAGTDGTHIGPFGSSNPYVLSGIPPLPTIDELSVPHFASPGSTLTIRVKVGARP